MHMETERKTIRIKKRKGEANLGEGVGIRENGHLKDKKKEVKDKNGTKNRQKKKKKEKRNTRERLKHKEKEKGKKTG